ncbi:hypothetical protein TNCV_3838901, partial [Trichonephila clavipes]
MGYSNDPSFCANTHAHTRQEVGLQSGRGCYINQRKFEDLYTGGLPADCRKDFGTRKHVRWILRRCAVRKLLGAVDSEKVPTCGKPGLKRPGRPRGERIEKDHAASTCGPHSDSFNVASRYR